MSPYSLFSPLQLWIVQWRPVWATQETQWPTPPSTRWCLTGSLCWRSSSPACWPRPASDSSRSTSSPCSNRSADFNLLQSLHNSYATTNLFHSLIFTFFLDFFLHLRINLFRASTSGVISWIPPHEAIIDGVSCVCVSALQKAFRTGTSTRLDDRVYAMLQLKYQPLAYTMLMIHPALYRVDDLTDEVRRLTFLSGAD